MGTINTSLRLMLRRPTVQRWCSCKPRAPDRSHGTDQELHSVLVDAFRWLGHLGIHTQRVVCEDAGSSTNQRPSPCELVQPFPASCNASRTTTENLYRLGGQRLESSAD